MGIEDLLRKAFGLHDAEVEAARRRIWSNLQATIMDVSFAEAMQEIAAFFGVREINVFEGQNLKGLVKCSIPDVCEPHGENMEIIRPFISIYREKVNLSYQCGCVYLGTYYPVVAA